MAYASNETGTMEVYVSPFPIGSGKWQVSSGGGLEPKWRQDGKELFYVSTGGKMMVAAVTVGARRNDCYGRIYPPYDNAVNSPR